MTATQALARLRSGELTVEALARACLERVSERDEAVRGWAFLDPEAVLEKARELDARAFKGPLHGLPVAVKDVILTEDMPTQHNSPLYRGHRPGQDAGCVATLRAAGALIFGKTDTTEFAAGGRWAATGNPHNPAHSAGGSSSGSGAAVGDLHVPLSLGTQTGGSLIRPASFNGVFALKPTWGAVSREGAKLYSAMLDTVGWYGRSVADLRLLAELFELLAEPAEPVPPLAGLRIAVCGSPVWEQAEAATREAIAETARRLGAAGATVVPLELPDSFALLPTEHHKAVLHGEGRGSFLSLYRAHGARLHDDFQGRATNREAITPAQLRAAYDTAAQARAAFDEIAAGFHAVLTPSATGTAPEGRNPGNPIFNQMWTLLHVPCVNVPGLTAANGLPVGVTLTGPRFADRALLDVAERVAPLLGAL